MSKIVAATLATGGAVTVTVGGSYLLQKGSSGVESKKSGAQSQVEEDSGQKGGQGVSAPKTTKQDTLEFDTLKKFKDGKGGKCVKDLFGPTPEIDFNAAGGAGPSEETFFGTAPTDIGENTKGCLIINWEKNEAISQDKNWNGTFTGTWAFVNGGKGFITFNVAKTHASEKKLELTGVFYLLDKDTAQTPNKGIVKWKKEVESGKDLPSSNVKFEEKFPKANSGSVFQLGEFTKKDYWGFVDDKDQLDKISGSVTEGDLVKKGSGTWKKDGSNKVGEWSEDFEWGNYIYDKSTFDLSKNLESFVGTGALDDTSTKNTQG